jgi:DNA polymerase I
MNKRPPKNGETVEPIKNTLLVDGNSLFKVSFFGAKNLYNGDGEHIGGVYSFITTLRKILTEDLYHRVFVFWDGNFSGKLRYEFYEPYKSGRGKDFVNGTQPTDLKELKQRKIIWDYLSEMYVRQIKDEVVESDDFIGYYCLNKEENEKITIMSGDRDFLQLLSEDVRIYFLDLKEYIDINNYKKYFCYNKENSVLIKTMVGDTSDTIKGIKGLGEDTLLLLFPEISERKVTLEEILEKAEVLQNERLNKKLKPLKVLDNILNRVTVGVQKEKIYEINDKLVNLSKPLLTNKAIDELNSLKEGTLDSSGRELKQVINMMKRDGLDKVIGENRITDYLIPFKRLISREQNF